MRQTDKTLQRSKSHIHFLQFGIIELSDDGFKTPITCWPPCTLWLWGSSFHYAVCFGRCFPASLLIHESSKSARFSLQCQYLYFWLLSAKHFIKQVELSCRVIGLSTVQCGEDSWRPLCPLCPASAVWAQSEQHRALHHHTLRHVLYCSTLHSNLL